MPRPSASKLRSLPTLIALPIPQFRRDGPPKPFGKWIPKRIFVSESTYDNPHKHAMALSIDALYSTIDLTLDFMSSKPSYAENITRWLLDFRNELKELENAIEQGWLDDLNITIDTEGVSGLDEILSAAPDLHPEDFPDECTFKLILFWQEEIKRRGSELFNICIMSVGIHEARKVLLDIKALRYPIS